MTPEMIDEKRYREYVAFQRAEMAIDFGGTALMSTVTLGIATPSRIEFSHTPGDFQPTEHQIRTLGQIPLANVIANDHLDHPLEHPDQVILGSQRSYTLAA